MILLRYYQSDHPRLQAIDSEYPFTFLRCYHEFEQSQQTDIGILWEEDSDVMVPVKFYNRRIFLFAQFLFRPIKDSETLSSDEEKNFLERATSYLKTSQRVQRIQHSPPFIAFSKAPDGSNFCPFGISFIDLTQDEDAIFQKIQSRTRRYIQKAAKENEFEIKTGMSCLQDFYGLHVSTMKREEAQSESFERLEQFVKFLSPENILCMVAYRSGVPEAGLVIPYSRYRAVLYYGGEAENSKGGVGNKWLHWEAMRQLKAHNVKKLVLGGVRMGNITGTKYEGIQFFKERFGPEFEQGVLWKMDLKPAYTQLFTVLINFRNMLSLSKFPPDIIDFYKQRNPVN